MERPSAPGNSPTHHEKVSKIQEVTGVNEADASSCLTLSEGDIEQAIGLIYSSMGQGPGYVAQETEGGAPAEGPRTAGDGEATGVVDQATGTVNNPIDLTNEEDDALQKALALSIQDMQRQSAGNGNISLEDQELSRALEASLADNKENMARLGLPLASLFVDPRNPHERKRVGHTPVGLKNIGNTCWFSAVIQSLFHIPVFRELILSYQPPPPPNGITELPQCVKFVLELQMLFALLLNSKRKYINPQTAIQSLKQAFAKEPSTSGAQQDVSEFTHKLLEWIEEAFKLAPRKEAVNPIVHLFNGHCKTEGVIGDQPFLNESECGAFPVQVQGHAHLHDSLEAATYNPEMQQETWFTRLPPILVLELSRFKYNQQSGQVEKIHDTLTFDRLLYMDRYLEKNKEDTRQRRKEVAKLRGKLADLVHRLQSYVFYNQKPVSIPEVLGMTLKFVHSHDGQEDSSHLMRGGEEEEEEEGREGGVGKRPRTSLHPLPQFVSPQEVETLERCLTRWIQEVEQDIAELRESIAITRATLDAVYSDKIMNTTQYHLHAVLVHQGQASGGHYWAYVRKPAGLKIGPEKRGEGRPVKTSVKQSKTAGVQDGPGPESHEGSCELPGGGGAVVVESQSGSEDSEVIEVTEVGTTDTAPQTGLTGLEDCQTSSETGQTGQAVAGSDEKRTESTSEYTVTEPDDRVSEGGQTGSETCETGSEGCKIVRGEQMEVVSAEECSGEDVWLKFNDVSVTKVRWSEVVKESYGGRQNTSAYCLVYVNTAAEEQWAGNVMSSTLPQRLQFYVDSDNAGFKTEIVEYNTRLEKIKAAKHVQWEDEAAKKAVGVAEDTEAAAHPAAAQRVGPKQDRSPEQMQVDSPPLPPVDTLLIKELKTKLEQKHRHLTTTILPDRVVDPRAIHLGTYTILSRANEWLVRAVLLEEIIEDAERENREDLRILAKKEFVAFLSQSGAQTNLNCLRALYQLFRATCYHCVMAVRNMAEQEWEAALAHAVRAFFMNSDVVRQASANFAVDEAIVGCIRRQALLGISASAYQLFENGNIREAIVLANSMLIPGLKALSQKPCEGDEEVMEGVREEWCQCLTHPSLPEEEQDQLADLLTRILEDYTKAPNLTQPSTPDTLDRQALTYEFCKTIEQVRQLLHKK